MRVWAWLGAALLAAILVAACAPATRLTAVWSTAGTPPRFDRIVVVGLSASDARRRALETAFTMRIEGAASSQPLLSTEQAPDRDRARAVVSPEQFDAAVIARFVAMDPSATYVPGTTYWGPAPYALLWGYWTHGWTAVQEPGYLRGSELVALETNVYSVASGELVWSSRSETISPLSIDVMLESVVESTVRQLERRRVVH